MAVWDRLRNWWWFSTPEKTKSSAAELPQIVAFDGRFELCPLTTRQIDEVWRLDRRCFVDGEAYTRETFQHLLEQPTSLCFRAIIPSGAMIGFIVAVLEEDGTGHITTIGVAPECRRHGIAFKLLEKAEDAFRRRSVRLMRLEVRSSNFAAQQVYLRAGYIVTQRLASYYSNGGDGLMMVKSIV
jgi:ribosomal-protein-alanine N-acetyltransferase